MATDEYNFGDKTPSGGSGGSAGRGGASYPKVDESVVEYILAALQARGEDVSWWTFDEDANEIPEEMREEFGLPEGTTHNSLESMAPRDIDAGYVGNTPRVLAGDVREQVENGELPEEALPGENYDDDQYVNHPEWTDVDLDRHILNAMMKSVNGHHRGLVDEALGEDNQVKFGIGKRSETSDREEQLRTTRIYTSQVGKADLRIRRAMRDVGEMEQVEFEEWCRENGYADEVDD